MKTFDLLKDNHIVELLKKHNLFDYVKEYNSKKIHPESEEVFPFVKELFSGVLPLEQIKNVFFGAGKYPTGFTTLYAWAQIKNVCELYNDLKIKFPLYEVGFKRCDQKHIQEIIEISLDTKFKKIGNCLIYSSLYELYEEPKYGILFSVYTQNEDRWAFERDGKIVGMAISSSAYTGLIIPGFDLTYKLSLLFCERLKNNEIEFPYNRYGAVDISDLTKVNVTPRQAKIAKNKMDKYYNEHKKFPEDREYNKESAFIFDTKVEPKVKTILKEWNKTNV